MAIRKAAPKSRPPGNTIKDLDYEENYKAKYDPQFPKGSGFRKKPAIKKATGLLSPAIPKFK